MHKYIDFIFWIITSLKQNVVSGHSLESCVPQQQWSMLHWLSTYIIQTAASSNVTELPV